MGSKVFVARQRGGLCNNLKCYLSAARIAARDAGDVATDCTDLLRLHDNLTDIASMEDNRSRIDVRRWRFMILAEDELPAGFAQSAESRGFRDADPDGRNIDFEYDRIPSSIRESYLKVLRDLQPKPTLLQKVDAFATRHFDAETISMHLRTWLTDHWDQAPKRNARYYDETAYRRIIEDHPTQRIFLSSDNAAHADKLAREYGDRILLWPDESGLSSTESAYINLRLLGCNDHIVGSRLSTFTEMAWWYTGCSARITLL